MTRETLMRPNDVAKMFGVSRGTIWNWVKNKSTFPKPQKLSANITVWKESELQTYMDKYAFVS